MRNIVLFFAIFLLSNIHLEAQNLIILNSGESVEYKKYKIDRKKDIVTIKKPEPKTIKIADVNYLINYLGEVIYLKNKPISSIKIDSANSDNKNSYIEMTKMIEGIISIYSYTECYNSASVGPAPANTYCFTYYYIEKGDEFEELTFDLLSNLGNDLNDFSEYFSDDNESYQKLISENFKAKKNRLFDLIRDYNIRKYDLQKSSTENEMCNAIFYRSFTGENKELVAEIDLEREQVSIPFSSYQLVRLYNDKPMKICINNDNHKQYHLVSGSKYITKYYNIRLKNDGEIELELKNKREFERYLEMLRKNKSN